jgi:hypothetical protein
MIPHGFHNSNAVIIYGPGKNLENKRGMKDLLPIFL